jgi:Bacterial EndoU nuclease
VLRKSFFGNINYDNLTNKTGGFATGEVRLKSGASVTPYNGGYQTKIQIYHEDLYRIQLNDRNIPISEKGWKTKTKESTFFPDNWAQEQVLEEIALAHSNKSFVKHSPPNDLYHGQSSNGIWIEMPISPSGKIESAYFE